MTQWFKQYQRPLKCFALVSALSLSGLLVGCGSLPEPKVAPKSLVEFKQSVELSLTWRDFAAKGAGEQGYLLTPVIANNIVYAIDREGNLTAWQQADGKFLWEAELKQAISSGLAYANEQLLVGTQNGELLALSAAGGELLWRTRLSTVILATPQINPELKQVVVQTADGKVSALDLSTGRLQWSLDGEEGLLTLHGTAAPKVTPALTFTGFASGKLAAIDNRNGQLVWDVRVAIPSGRTDIERLVDIDGQPLLTSKGLLVVTSFQGRVMALDPKSGRAVWERKDSSFYPAVEGYGNLLYVDDASRIIALDSRSGGVLWNQDALEGRRLTAPVIWGDALAVADYEGYIHLFALTDGHPIARIQADTSGIEHPLTVASNQLFAVANNGRVIAIKR